VHVRPSTGEVYAPVAMWMESLDLVLERLAAAMEAHDVPMARIAAVSGSGQQHGSVYWAAGAEDALAALDPERPLVAQLAPVLAHDWSPNWQDQSTQRECDAFDAELGGRERLAEVTGSGAHHVRFSPSSLTLPPSLPRLAYDERKRQRKRCEAADKLTKIQHV